MTEDWNAAFISLVQENDGVALANLLRRVMPVSERGPANIPIEIVYELAQLLDPRSVVNRFAKPPRRLPVKLKVTGVSRSQFGRIKRDQCIWAEVSALFNQGQSVSEAAISVGKKYDLSERRVTEIWSAARDAFPMLNSPREKPRKVTRRHPR